MKSSLAYKNCLIYIESFQLTQSSGWIPRYTLTRQDEIPSGRHRLDKTFLSKDEADKFALEDAMHWIDQSCSVTV